MKKLNFIIIGLMIFSNLYAQVPEFMDNQDGKCYKSYSFEKPIITNKVKLFQYIGLEDIEELEPETVIEASLEIMPAHDKWVKREDAWCLIKVPPIKQNFTIVTDTTKIKDFKIIEIETFELINVISTKKKLETLCQNKINPSLLREIKEKLLTKGYTFSSKSDNFELMQVLNKYQEDNILPLDYITYGETFSISIQTLEALGIKY